MKIPEFKLERYFARYEFTAPYLLSSSDCESFTINELLAFEENAENEFKNLNLGYTESLGNPKLRQEISNLYSNVNEGEIIVFSGAEEGIFSFMNAILTVGDEIIVQFPGYQSLYEIAKAIGVNVIKWEMDPKNNWKLDINFLEKNISEKTRVIVINNPHNPTGNLITYQEYEDILNIARSNNIYLFSDEVYRFTEFEETNMLPPAADVYQNALSLGVMSKSFGLPGLRIGWLATKNKEIFNKIASQKDYTTICNSAPSEFLSLLALRNKDEILDRNRKIIRNNMRILDEFFLEYNKFVSWTRPKGGSIGFVYLNEKEFLSAHEFCQNLIQEKGVLLVPGPIFDYEDSYFRIGFGRANLNECLNHLKSYFDNLLGK